MQVKKLRRACEHCGTIGEVGEDIFWVTDPYMQDVDGVDQKQWLHVGCCDEIARDI